jgi:hypothetical protein
MRPLKLYRIEPEAFPPMHVAARSNQQAAQIYVTWEASIGRHARSFSTQWVRTGSLDSEQQNQLQSLLAVSTEGIAYFDSLHGWSIDSDGWTSFDVTEHEER